MDRLLELCVKYGLEISVRYVSTLDAYEIHANKRVGSETYHCVHMVSLRDLYMIHDPEWIWSRVYERFCREFGLRAYEGVLKKED